MDQRNIVASKVVSISGEILNKNLSEDEIGAYSNIIQQITPTVETGKQTFLFKNEQMLYFGRSERVYARTREEFALYLIRLTKEEYIKKLKADPYILCRYTTEKGLSDFPRLRIAIEFQTYSTNFDVLTDIAGNVDKLATIYSLLITSYEKKNKVVIIIKEMRSPVFDFLRNLLMTLPLNFRVLSFVTHPERISDFDVYLITKKNSFKFPNSAKQDLIIFDIESVEFKSEGMYLSLSENISGYTSKLAEWVFEKDIDAIESFNSKAEKYAVKSVKDLVEIFNYFIKSQSSNPDEIIEAARIIKNKNKSEAKKLLDKILSFQITTTLGNITLEHKIDALHTLAEFDSPSFLKYLIDGLIALSDANKLNFLKRIIEEFKDYPVVKENSRVKAIKEKMEKEIREEKEKEIREEKEKEIREEKEKEIREDKLLIHIQSKAKKYLDSSNDEKKEIEERIANAISKIHKRLISRNLHEIYAGSEQFVTLTLVHQKFIESINGVINLLSPLCSNEITISKIKIIKESSQDFFEESVGIWKELEKYNWEKMLTSYQTVDEIFSSHCEIYNTYILEPYTKLKKLNSWIKATESESLINKMQKQLFTKQSLDKDLREIIKNFSSQINDALIKFATKNIQ